MKLTKDNLIVTSEVPVQGQRVLQIAPGIWIPVGFQKASGSDSSSTVPIQDIDIILGVVDQNGKFQPLSFNGQEAISSGQPQEVQFYMTWNTPGSTTSDSLSQSSSASFLIA